MGIGAISGFGSMAQLQTDYRINSVYGNPKAMNPIGKIGEDTYSGNPFAVLSKKDDEDELKIRANQEKPFDLAAAVQRAQYGMTTTGAGSESTIDLQGEMSRMMMGTRFSADTIPVENMLA